jgi:hypothetical protein
LLEAEVCQSNEAFSAGLLSKETIMSLQGLHSLFFKSSASESNPGLWANIHAKRKRGGTPAKPGSEAYPDKKNWSKLTSEKSARNMNLKNFMQPGPDRMPMAISMLDQAKSMVQPTDDDLSGYGVGRPGFENIINKLKNDPSEKYDFKSHKANPTLRALGYAGIGGLGGLAASKLTGQPLSTSIMATLAPAAAGGAAGYYSAGRHNENLLGTSKLLRDYGLLRPELLRKASPLLLD